jgi:hypothetical protein
MDKESKKLEKPAKVGAGIFREGVDESLVIEAAQRQYEYNKKSHKGKKAVFVFSSGQRMIGIIEHVPDGPSDNWVVQEIFSGRAVGTVEIRNYDYMRLCDS